MKAVDSKTKYKFFQRNVLFALQTQLKIQLKIDYEGQSKVLQVPHIGDQIRGHNWMLLAHRP